VDALYAEWKKKGAKIVSPPSLTSYGCYEFLLEDRDGRKIGIGRIKDNEAFFGETSDPSLRFEAS
jgi:hypothetical protein